MAKSKLTLACCLSLAAATTAHPAQEHLTLDEILVTDTLLEDQTSSVVESPVISRGRNIILPDVLKQEPDIDIKRRAAFGDTADILAIRGLSANRIMLNINDRPVNAAGVVGGHYIDWGTIPLDNIEKIEVHKGGSSARYGNNALGGVINVVTRRPTEEPTATVSANLATGDIDLLQNYRLTHSQKIGILSYSLSGSFQKADEFLWNNDFEGKNVATNFSIDMPAGGELSLGMQYANAVRGFMRNNRMSTDPDSPNFYRSINDDYPLSFGETFNPYSGKAFDPGPGAQWDKKKYYLDLGYSQPIGDTLVEFKVYQNHEDRDERNYSSSTIVPGSSDGELVLDRTVESDRSRGGNLVVSHSLEDHQIETGVDYKVLAYGGIELHSIDTVYNGKSYTGSEPSQEGRSCGYFLQDDWAISDSFTLTPGIRYDTYANENINNGAGRELEDDAVTPRLTGTYALTSADTLTASVYQALRTPGLPETYWWANGGLTKNTAELQPETNNAAELTYQHDLSKKDSVKVAGYYYKIDDYILFRGGYNPTVRGTYNLEDATLQGVSLDHRHTFTKWLAGRASLTYQHSEKGASPFAFDSLSDTLDYVPEWKATLGAECQLPYQSVLSVAVRYTGDSEMIYLYTTGSGQAMTQKTRKMEVDSSVTVGLDLKIPLSKQWELNLYADNLLDEEYEERFGYAMPGIVVGSIVKFSY
ncbi:MAG: TonB-dependent receptor [Pseudomonadota bacterium]